ncbi:uncharacterized protein VTP21DRAFT_1702 [Calcarisporiella thermophila]|uniref:uncharacterized protein n=1 Tax=Calcarisporiella thermophila TaxID=911321 RepID=UPI0037446CFC
MPQTLATVTISRVVVRIGHDIMSGLPGHGGKRFGNRFAIAGEEVASVCGIVLISTQAYHEEGLRQRDRQSVPGWRDQWKPCAPNARMHPLADLAKGLQQDEEGSRLGSVGRDRWGLRGTP